MQPGCRIITRRGLFSPAEYTMQLFMWQHDIVGVAHHIMDCLNALGSLCLMLALVSAPDDTSTSSSSARAVEHM